MIFSKITIYLLLKQSINSIDLVVNDWSINYRPRIGQQTFLGMTVVAYLISLAEMK
ncbi:MAG: hypothetical protein RL447_489 [Bacteroidota bacterium]